MGSLNQNNQVQLIDQKKHKIREKCIFKTQSSVLFSEVHYNMRKQVNLHRILFLLFSYNEYSDISMEVPLVLNVVDLRPTLIFRIHQCQDAVSFVPSRYRYAVQNPL